MTIVENWLPIKLVLSVRERKPRNNKDKVIKRLKLH